MTPFRSLAPVAWVSGPDGKAAMRLAEVPATGILRGDGRRLTPREFAAEHGSYCGAARQDRAAALAVGFVLLTLLALFGHRWLRAKRTREPFRRPWSRPQR